MLSSRWFCAALLLLALVAPGQTQASDERAARVRTALQACTEDVNTLCSNTDQNDLRAVLRCLGVNAPSVSVTCKVALMAALRPEDPPAPSPYSPSSGTSSTDPTTVPQTQLQQCMPGIMRTCEPQVIELMTNPLDAEGEDLVTCAKAHSSTIGGTCEALVEKLTRDGFATELISCGQKFLGLCPAESIALLASQGQSDVDWSVVKSFVKCLHGKKDEISGTCTVVSDALMQDGEGKYDSANANTKKAYGYGYGVEWTDAKGSDARPRRPPHHHGGGGAAGVVAVLFSCCLCVMIAGTAYWKRDQIGNVFGPPRAHPTHAAYFQALDEEQGAGLTTASVVSTAPISGPPEYAVQPQDDARMNIVTAQPIA